MHDRGKLRYGQIAEDRGGRDSEQTLEFTSELHASVVDRTLASWPSWNIPGALRPELSKRAGQRNDVAGRGDATRLHVRRVPRYHRPVHNRRPNEVRQLHRKALQLDVGQECARVCEASTILATLNPPRRAFPYFSPTPPYRPFSTTSALPSPYSPSPPCVLSSPPVSLALLPFRHSHTPTSGLTAVRHIAIAPPYVSIHFPDLLRPPPPLSLLSSPYWARALLSFCAPRCLSSCSTNLQSTTHPLSACLRGSATYPRSGKLHVPPGYAYAFIHLIPFTDMQAPPPFTAADASCQLTPFEQGRHEPGFETDVVEVRAVAILLKRTRVSELLATVSY
ncbi:hypothetical protein C8J57DRAFT_1245961 [Mycena rebaudengoi]|nr:hypothetical protein C8J57DRAFT_1245961 [Mycena rebaudengoi]